MTSIRYGRPFSSVDGYPISFHGESRRRKMDGDEGSRVPWQYAFVASNCLDFILKRRVRHPCHRTEHSCSAGDLVSVLLLLARTSQAQSLAFGRPDLALMAKGMTDGRSLTSFAPRSRTRFSKTSMVTNLIVLNLSPAREVNSSRAAFRNSFFLGCALSSRRLVGAPGPLTDSSSVWTCSCSCSCSYKE